MNRRIVQFEINQRIMECLMVKVENEQGSIQYAALNITALEQQNVSDDEMKIFKNAFGNAGWVKINNWEFSNGAKVHSKLRPNATGARIASHEVPATSGPASITARSSLLLFDCYVKSKLAHSNNLILPMFNFG